MKGRLRTVQCEAHGRNIWAESQEGQGEIVRFVIRLEKGTCDEPCWDERPMPANADAMKLASVLRNANPL
ncbi:hypothetical protein BN2476_1230009 [Paraburkholderia piptadeniae]|uniref:Uncharacterized protein n=1 Tax=Paraburkholderia piptadeniae TaxID=1701573 RepID=A0A1N7SVU5_9BURK|nr:hypothetical protein BN2476_1230009 [Paraburkholderia piptadeniae]